MDKLKNILIGITFIIYIIIPSEQIAQAFSSQSKVFTQIDQKLSDWEDKGITVGVSIRNASHGKLIYSHNGQLRLHPASNMKLITGAAALNVLGPDYTFTTEVRTDGVIKGNTLHGNIYLRGKGDPTLVKKDFDYFAKQLKKKGIGKITGHLIGDDSWYDSVRYSQDLNWSDEENYPGAAVSALSFSPNEDFDTGTIIIDVYPGTKIGNKAKIKLTPETDYVKIINKAKTVGKKEENTVSIEREHGSNNIIIDGSIPIGEERVREWKAVWEPTAYALSIFKHSLNEHGIQLDHNKIKIAKTPKKTEILAHKTSIPLQELLLPFMKLSNNSIAEVLVKEMGRVSNNEGSWDKGLQVMEEMISSFGVNTNSILLRDGSGMSHKNLLPANELTEMLYAIQTKDWFPIFEASLPVSGEKDRLIGGTLRNRLDDKQTKGKMKAKTGSLTGVNTLSGYVDTKSGEKLIFSLLFNNLIEEPVTEMQDEIIKLLIQLE